MNEYLKELAGICGINKNLSMHVARHTFATSVTLSNGVPIETVPKMLGHTSLKDDADLCQDCGFQNLGRYGNAKNKIRKESQS